MLIREIENSIKQKDTRNFLNIIKSMSVEDFGSSDEGGLNVVHICVKHNAMKELLILLDSLPEQQQQLINQKTKGLCPKTPIQLASESKNEAVTKLLIDVGVDLNEQEIDKMSKDFRGNSLFVSYLNELRDVKCKKEKKFWIF